MWPEVAKLKLTLKRNVEVFSEKCWSFLGKTNSLKFPNEQDTQLTQKWTGHQLLCSLFPCVPYQTFGKFCMIFTDLLTKMQQAKQINRIPSPCFDAQFTVMESIPDYYTAPVLWQTVAWYQLFPLMHSLDFPSKRKTKMFAFSTTVTAFVLVMTCCPGLLLLKTSYK